MKATVVDQIPGHMILIEVEKEGVSITDKASGDSLYFRRNVWEQLFPKVNKGFEFVDKFSEILVDNEIK